MKSELAVYAVRWFHDVLLNTLCYISGSHWPLQRYSWCRASSSPYPIPWTSAYISDFADRRTPGSANGISQNGTCANIHDYEHLCTRTEREWSNRFGSSGRNVGKACGWFQISSKHQGFSPWCLFHGLLMISFSKRRKNNAKFHYLFVLFRIFKKFGKPRKDQVSYSLKIPQKVQYFPIIQKSLSSAVKILRR